MKKILLACAILSFAALPALAADNPWVGTWKLDPAKSHLAGNTFNYSKASDGMMHYTNGSTFSYNFAIDGKDYKTAGNRTISWTADGQDAWTTVLKADGAVLSTGHHHLSPDSKTLTVTITGTRPDGSSYNTEVVNTRVSGTSGLVGEWRSTKVDLAAVETYIFSIPSPGVFRMEYPEYHETIEGKPDGTDHPIQGPHAPKNLTQSFKVVSPNKITYVNKLDGKPMDYGVQTLAADGKSLTDTSWRPGKESQKETDFYVKQ